MRQSIGEEDSQQHQNFVSDIQTVKKLMQNVYPNNGTSIRRQVGWAREVGGSPPECTISVFLLNTSTVLNFYQICFAIFSSLVYKNSFRSLIHVC